MGETHLPHHDFETVTYYFDYLVNYNLLPDNRGLDYNTLAWKEDMDFMFRIRQIQNINDAIKSTKDQIQRMAK